jgi:sister-chromatid-cohesion protein PDS5
MTQTLVTLVDESQNLPPDVVDIIVAQFLRASLPNDAKDKKDVDDKQSTLIMKELPEAYNMSKTICNSCPEKMARYVSQYFNEVILEVTGGVPKTNGHRRGSDGAAESEDDDGTNGPSEADMKELRKAHKLLRELWRASPAVLQNVIPQLEAELSAENVELRLLATETLGDIISGIGAAGPPPPPIMDPAAYPPVSLESYPQRPVSDSILTTPISPQSFAQTHGGVYNSFMGRQKDKSPVVRAGWTTAIGRIIITSAGGIGLSRDEEALLINGLNEKLNDGDERVRLAAVKVVAGFGFRDIMTRLVPNGHVNKSGSVLGSFADRARDRKHNIRVEAMTGLARIWGVATGEILAGNTTVSENLGAIPSKIFDAFYANDLDLNVLLDQVMFEQLIPLSYPPTKSRKVANGDSQTQSNGTGPIDADKIRTQRILLLVSSLDPKSSKAFLALQARQPMYAKVLELFLKRCEEYNGGVAEKSKDLAVLGDKLDAVAKWFSNLLPNPAQASQDLTRFAKLHDRRSYQLLRFAMAPESDFNTVHKAIKEFRKKFTTGSHSHILETLDPIIYRSSCLIYNISHQPVILQFSRSDEDGLGATANVIMKEISDKHPEIFQASVKELCKAITDGAPSATKANDPGSVDTLKALASFAKDGKNKIPSDRKFIQALKDFALYGTPAKVAKYAVSILTTTERKEMHLKDLLDKSMEDWSYGSDHFLTKLATLSQLTLLDPKSTEDANDEILDITTQQILLKNRNPATDSDPEWQADGEVDEECEAKCWALKTLVNRLRSTTDPDAAKKISVPVYKLLNALIAKEGELNSKQNNTPAHHKARLRLLAAQQMLKICTIKMFDELLSPSEFNRLSFVAQAHLAEIRRGFVEKLQKYIVKGRLSNRFVTIIFLTAFEPQLGFRNSIMTWIRSRVKLCSDLKNQVFESVFPRLLHLLAHHPDYSTEGEELRDHGRYILYYLMTVASEANLPHIYKYAERVKSARDALPNADSERLYLLSDLAQTLIKKWQEKKGWTMQAWPAKVGMPKGLFGPLPSHEVAQEIAEKNYLPEEMEELLDDLVRKSESKKVSNPRLLFCDFS